MTNTLESNVGVKWVLNEPDSPRAIQLRDDFRQGVHALIAPDVFPVEATHAIAKAERRGVIPVGEGAQKLIDVVRFVPRLNSSFDLLSRAYAIASAARNGVHDCLCIALAEQEGCELVTSDSVLVKKFQTQFPFIVLLSALP